jgi:hypothetical protein
MHFEIAGVDTSEVIEAESGVSILELLQNSSDVESHACDGSWTHGPRLDLRGFDIRGSSDRASIIWIRGKRSAHGGAKVTLESSNKVLAAFIRQCEGKQPQPAWIVPLKNVLLLYSRDAKSRDFSDFRGCDQRHG